MNRLLLAVTNDHKRSGAEEQLCSVSCSSVAGKSGCPVWLRVLQAIDLAGLDLICGSQGSVCFQAPQEAGGIRFSEAVAVMSLFC